MYLLQTMVPKCIKQNDYKISFIVYFPKPESKNVSLSNQDKHVFSLFVLVIV